MTSQAILRVNRRMLAAVPIQNTIEADQTLHTRIMMLVLIAMRACMVVVDRRR
jgi:hypothetical protein